MRPSVRVCGVRAPLIHGDQLEQRYEAKLGDWPLTVRRWCGAWFVELGKPAIFATDSHRLYLAGRELRSFLSQAARASQAVAS